MRREKGTEEISGKKKKAEFFQVNINKTKFTEGKTPKPRYVTFKLQKIKKQKKF